MRNVVGGDSGYSAQMGQYDNQYKEFEALALMLPEGVPTEVRFCANIGRKAKAQIALR